MASRKPITQANGVLEQLQTSVDTLTVGDYDLPNTISSNGKVLATVAGAATWEYASHADLTNLTVDDHHPKSHVHTGDGSGTVEHDSTANITVDQHHAQSHLHNSVDGSGDVYHGVLKGITTDAHHGKVHTHNGADGSGVVEHDDTANGTIANHDTGATGTELDTLTDGSNADALHVHAGIVAPSGDTTFYLATTGSDSTGDGSSGNPWKTVSHAEQVIYEMEWESAATATITIADGVYEFRETTIRNHSANIAITSTNAVYTDTITNVVSVSALGSGWYSVRFTITSTGLLSTSHFLCVRGIFGSKSWTNGAWEITAINSATDVTVRLWSRTLVPTTGAAGIATQSPLVIFHGIETPAIIITGDDVSFTGISFYNNSALATATCVNVEAASRVAFDDCSFNGYDGGIGIFVTSGFLTLDNSFFTDCSFGLWLTGAAYAYGNVCCFGGTDTGIIAYGSMFVMAAVTLSSCDTRGANCNQFSYGDIQIAIVKDCGTGFRINLNSGGNAGVAGTYGNNGTDLSPAINTEGNRNSYMQ